MKKTGMPSVLAIIIGIAIGIGISFLYMNIAHPNKQPDKTGSPAKPTDGEDVKIREVVEKEDNLGTLLTTEDILDWKAVLNSLKDHGTLDEQRIWGFLDETTRNKILEWKPGTDLTVSFKKSIIDGLNKIIERKDFYDKKAFSDIKIGKEGTELIDKGINNLDKKQILRLNRLLFEAIYPIAIARSNTMEFVYYAMAKQLSHKKDYKGALKYINKTLEMNPGSTLYLGEKSQIYEETTDDREMVKNLEKFLESKPDDISAISNLGRLYTDSGRSREAIEILTKRIDRLPKMEKGQPPDGRSQLYLSRAGAYYITGEKDKMFRDLAKAIELDPDNIRIRTERAGMYEVLGDMDKAKIDANYIVKNLPPPKTAVDYKCFAVAHRILGDQAKALKLINEAMEMKPSETRFYYERAMIYIYTDDKESARKDLDKIISGDFPEPDKMEARDLLKKLESK